LSKKVPSIITDNKFLIFLSKIPEHIRWVGTACFLLAIVTIWSLIFYFPALLRIRKYKLEIKNSQDQKTALASQSEKSKNIKKENVEIKKFLKNSFVPKNYEVTEKIVSFSNKFGVVCKSIVPINSKKSSSKSSFEKNKDYQVALSGEFASILKLLNKLQELKGSVNFKNIICYRGDNNKIEIKLTVELISRKI